MRYRSFRFRLATAMVLVAVGVLVLSYVATYGLVRRAIQENAVDSLRGRADDLAEIAGGADLSRRPNLRRVALQATDLQVINVRPNGEIVNAGEFPEGVAPEDLDAERLLAGEEVSGRNGDVVFLAIPTGAGQAGGERVVLAAETVDLSALRRLFPLLVLSGLLVLAVASIVAAALARRLSRPIRDIEQAAQQLATGDLSARAHVPENTDDELVALANTLNSMAAQLEHSRGSERAFLLSVSHDLRTPLTSIRGYAEALADGTLDEADPDDRKRAATVIGAEARRLERLVRDLLDLSRLDSRQFSLSPRPCDASEVVRDAAVAFVPQAGDLGITLDIRRGPVLAVDVDPERLAQIVANLVENALKYARARVEVYVAPNEQQEFALVVTDDGPGIPTDQMGMVFERLYTVRDTPGRTVGTGLGLAIVRELASAMGGRAWVDAAPEGGSRFVVALPTNVAHAAQ